MLPGNESSDKQGSQSDSSKKALETGKVAALDTWDALKLLWQDPVNGLPEALTTLGDNRAFNVGIVLCLAFAIACWLVLLKIGTFMMGFADLFVGLPLYSRLDFADYLRILLSTSVPAIAMIFVLWGIRKIFKGEGNLKQCTFVTGIAIFPITFFLLLSWLLGYSAPELISFMGFFCFTTFILFLNTALIGIVRISARNALFLVPILVVAALFITRVAFEILY